MKWGAEIVLLAGLAVAGAMACFVATNQNLSVAPLTEPQVDTWAQQVTPARTREPLDGKSYTVKHLTVFLPMGIISDEVQTELWEFESSFVDGKPLASPYNLEYVSGYNTSFDVHFIEIVQQVYLPKEAYLQSLIAYGPQPPFPGTTPEPWDFPFPLDIPFGGAVLIIIYKGEWALLSGLYGRFKVGEEQRGTFWFLFEQLGWNRAIIADSEAYEEYWGPERAKWINNPTLTPLPPTEPATPIPLPPTMEGDEPFPSLVPSDATLNERG